MRISDWSSDVCSSDLTADVAAIVAAPVPAHAPIAAGSTGNPAPDEAAKVLAAPPLPETAILPIVDQGAKPKTSEDRAASGGTANPLPPVARSEEHTSELQSLMRISYAVFCLKKKTKTIN